MKKQLLIIAASLSLMPVGNLFALQNQTFIKSTETLIAKNISHSDYNESLMEKGDKKYKSKDYKGAIDDFNKALDIPSKIADQKAWREGIHAEIYFDRGWSKYELGDINSALKDWTKSSKLGNQKATKAIKLYANKDQINVDISEKQLADRKKKWQSLKEPPKRGVLAKYARSVASASEGAVTDNF